MDSDRDFGHTEKMVRAKANIYSVDEYQDLMARSQRKAKPVVTRMAGKLYCLKDLPQHTISLTEQATQLESLCASET